MNQINAEKMKILNFAKAKFFREGFYKTRMDSIASELKISKKTIYKHFPTKDKLVEEVVHNFMEYMVENIDNVLNKKENAVLKTLNLMRLMSNTILTFSEKWISDIKIYKPKLWEQIDRFRTNKMFAVLTKIIEQGKKEKLFDDKPTELIITIFISSIRSIVNPNYLFHKKYSYKVAIETTFEILFNGILTAKGKKIFNKSTNR